MEQLGVFFVNLVNLHLTANCILNNQCINTGNSKSVALFLATLFRKIEVLEVKTGLNMSEAIFCHGTSSQPYEETTD